MKAVFRIFSCRCAGVGRGLGRITHMKYLYAAAIKTSITLRDAEVFPVRVGSLNRNCCRVGWNNKDI
jgi:hypothetical protein